MILAVILLVLGMITAVIGLPIIEGVGALLFLTVVLQFLLSPITHFSTASSYILLYILLFVAYLVQRWRGLPRIRRPGAEDLFYVQVLIIGYIAVLSFALLWPDFIAIGERLRDYALLSSVIQHPGEALEPWMSGASLNYYLFWYRLGALFSSLAGLEIWDTYHQLQAFTFSFFVAVLVRLFRAHLGFSRLNAVFFAVVIALGSNLSGVWHALYKDHNWWGPSRVIPGAINEFPAWSFLLGDLHPHFLNLALVPFCLVLGLTLAPAIAASFGKRFFAIAPLVLGVYLLWIYNSNAWEIPVALLIVGSVVLTAFVFRKSLVLEGASAPMLVQHKALFIAVMILCGASLYISSRNIQPLGTQLRFVVLPGESIGIPQTFDSISKGLGLPITPAFPAQADGVPAVYGTSVKDLMKHWGMPLIAIMAASVALMPSVTGMLVSGVVLLGLAFAGNGLLLLLAIAGVTFVRLYKVLRSGERQSLAAICMEGIGLALLAAVIFPEVLFFDDPYGGENERMNTIFKFYSASWALFHAYAFFLCAKAIAKLNLEMVPSFRFAAQALFGALCLGFFFQTVGDRQQKDFRLEPRNQGLSTVEINHPGGGTAVQKLEKMPRGVVLETQGGAYNYSSFVSTLSGNMSYLGWANHVNLLLNNNPEVKRREDVTREFYSTKNCEDKRKIVLSEGITYVVFGTLEKQAYPDAGAEDFSCLSPVIKDGEYTIYSGKIAD